MLLNLPAPFLGGIKSKDFTSSLPGEGYLLKVGSFSFVSPVSASAVSKPIFEIKSTEDKSKIFTPMLSGSGKQIYHLVLWLWSPHQKTAVVGYLLIPEQVDRDVLSLVCQQGGVGYYLRHCPKSRQIMIVVQWLVISPCNLREKQLKKVIE